MKKLLFVVLILALAVPAMAARVAVTPIQHEPECVYQVYPACEEDGAQAFAGYAGLGDFTITSVPGILAIVPGTPTWANFIGAANANSPGGLWPGTWRVQNVILKKETPEVFKCSDVFPPKVIQQQGTPNIRLWWPLMYEIPGTCWTLIIQYATSPIPDPNKPGSYLHYDDDGPGPNPPSPVHQEVWKWCVCAQFDQPEETMNTLALLLELFHELPFGRDEVPLIFDEELYVLLQDLVAQAAAYAAAGDLVNASIALMDFELEVMDNCAASSPLKPWPYGDGVGIASTDENPACCKLLVDADYIGQKYNIMQQAK